MYMAPSSYSYYINKIYLYFTDIMNNLWRLILKIF